MNCFRYEMYDLQHDKKKLHKDNYVCNKQTNDLREQFNYMQYENSTMSSDDDSFQQDYDEDGIDEQDQMQYESSLSGSEIDDLHAISLVNPKSVFANKRLKKHLYEPSLDKAFSKKDLNRLLSEEKKKNKRLEIENSRLAKRHDSCEHNASVHCRKATLEIEETKNVRKKNTELKLKSAEARRNLYKLQAKYDKLLRNMKTFGGEKKRNITDSEKQYIKIQRPKKALENAQPEHHESQLKIQKLEQRIKQAEGELKSERNRNAVFSKQISEYKEYALTTDVLNKELKNEKSRNAVLFNELTQYNKSSETLRRLTEELESERSRHAIVLNERNKYKGQIKQMKASQVDLEKYSALLRQEQRNSEDLRNVIEHNQQLKQQFSDLKTSGKDLVVSIDYLNNKVRQLSNVLEGKEREINRLNIELQQKNQVIEDRMSEIVVMKEKNVENQRLISDLQSAINQYKSNLKDTSPDSAKLANANSNLNRELEKYQRELQKVRSQMGTATENYQHICSDLRTSKQALGETVHSLNEQMKELTMRKDSDINNLQFECQRKCKEVENTMNELSLIKEKNETNDQLVTDLQIELDQYKSNMKDKDSDLARMSYTISNLRRVVETYKSELNQTRDELRNANENTLKKTEQACIDERGSLNDRVREFTYMLKGKDSDVRKMETKMAEFSSIEKKNNKLEEQVTDLQIEVNQCRSDLNDKRSASTKLTNTISNLRREVETYQSELKQARDELRNATEKTQQLERQFSDLKKSDQAIIGETGFLNDTIRELTNNLKGKDNDIRKMEKKMAELSSIEEKNIKLERQVTDLHIEVNQYKSDLNDKGSASAELTNTNSNLRREMETYQSELNQARDELRNATENNQQMERQMSDLKKRNKAFIDETGSLNDKLRELTNILKRKDSDVLKMEEKMAECSLMDEKNIKLEGQVTDLQSEVNQYRSDLNDNSSASTKLANTITHLKREAKTYQSELNQARDELRNATDNTQKMKRQISDLKRSEQALIDEKGSLNDNIRQFTDILKGKDSDIRKIEKKMAEYSLIKEENAKAERRITDLQIEIKQYKSELKDKSSNLTKQTITLSNLSHESDRCKGELKEAHEKIMKLDQQLKTVNDEHEKCNHLISSLRKENAKLSMYKDNDQTRRSEATLSQREHELSLALEKSRRELREVQHELDDTKTRLSKVMGQKLTDNNPNIADLSDKNRPTKLAERYSELYDNQWTDAFEVICKQLHDEQSTIESLIDILRNAAKYCREEAMTQLETIQGILLPRKTGSTFPSLVHKNLKDCRKALGEQTGAAIYERYLKDIAKQRQQALQLDVKPYVKECVELCWLMSIQDPPVVVAPELKHGGNFDTDFYKAYTKSGPLIDYVVWPALCLHEKGPLLCKGIAQGYGGKKTKY